MTYRASSNEVNEVFEILRKAIGKRVAESLNNTGAWILDYAKEYGSYTIQEIINDSGAKDTPLGDYQYTATELVELKRWFPLGEFDMLLIIMLPPGLQPVGIL